MAPGSQPKGALAPTPPSLVSGTLLQALVQVKAFAPENLCPDLQNHLNDATMLYQALNNIANWAGSQMQALEKDMAAAEAKMKDAKNFDDAQDYGTDVQGLQQDMDHMAYLIEKVEEHQEKLG
ncbi:hypothetical protein M409DRAFT_19919 [Zasmidium cellare ATCC 36951]|uniref:Uncharacterized protein n=1 Tax=Zasmidium cellare ATCC 36951 TaxID=1080233 RepID=A0A6A6CQR7_ZASCE|nr:uncharacterized protein M409DRAFT_19919 [Zasmidium cellare ATCC 36951]KAF2169504.1 hypothetical protein M409DRAFT_19919 [Zasmidium cellare ATCC 36951]